MKNQYDEQQTEELRSLVEDVNSVVTRILFNTQQVSQSFQYLAQAASNGIYSFEIIRDKLQALQLIVEQYPHD